MTVEPRLGLFPNSLLRAESETRSVSYHDYQQPQPLFIVRNLLLERFRPLETSRYGQSRDRNLVGVGDIDYGLF